MSAVRERLEELRAAIRAESISQDEVAELQGLADHIEPGDVELAEWAGIPEQEFALRGTDCRGLIEAHCKSEGLSIMADVFGIIMDRGEATPERVWLFVQEDEDTQTLYEEFIVAGINSLSDYIAGQA